MPFEPGVVAGGIASIVAGISSMPEDRSVAGTYSGDRSVSGTYSDSYEEDYDDGGYGGGGDYGYGGGGGGGGGSSSSAKTTPEQQQETQAQINNLGANYNQRKVDLDRIVGDKAKTLANTVKGRAADLNKAAAQRKADMDKIAKQKIDAVNQQRNANKSALTQSQRNLMKQISWQPNQQKEQSTLMALRNRMGNSAYGSAIQDLREGMGRVDDMNDVELINAWKQNDNAAYQNWYQAEQSLIGDYNDLVSNTLDSYSQYKADYADQISKLQTDYNSQISNMRTDYEDQVSQLNSQYQTALSNIKPLLATAENITNARAGQDVSVGEDTDKYTLPKIDLHKAIDIKNDLNLSKNSIDLNPGSALAKLLVLQRNANAVNDRTKNYIRPDRAAYRVGGANGDYNTRTAANSGFSDNLAAFRRV